MYFENDKYRIVEIKKSLSEQIKLVIQMIGKSIFIELSPREIAADDQLLEGFSKKDVRTITYFACEQIKKPKYKIIMQEFCDTLNKIIFKFKKLDSGERVVKTAQQISGDKNFINDLSREDVQVVSYVAGYEHSMDDRLQMEIARRAVSSDLLDESK